MAIEDGLAFLWREEAGEGTGLSQPRRALVWRPKQGENLRQ